MGREGEVKGPDLFKDRWDARHVWHAGFFHALPNLQKGWPTPVASVFFPLVPALCILEFIPLYWGWSPEKTQKTLVPKPMVFSTFIFLNCAIWYWPTHWPTFFPLKLTFILGLHKGLHLPVSYLLEASSLTTAVVGCLYHNLAHFSCLPIVFLWAIPCSQSLNHTNNFHI